MSVRTPRDGPVTVTLRCRDPAALEVVVRCHPEGGALLWIGPTGSALGPVDLDPRDVAEFSTLLDAVFAGEVVLTLRTFLGRPDLATIRWPGGRWNVSVSPGTGLLGRRGTVTGAAWPSVQG